MSGTFKGKIAGEQKRRGGILEMAMYENEGYCPGDNFMYFQVSNIVQKSVLGILGDRPRHMVYDKEDHYWSRDMQDSVIDALLCGDGILGIQVATYLELADPPKSGRKIVVHDIINPAKADASILYFNEKEWVFNVNGDVDCSLKSTSKSDKRSIKKLYWDDRYLVCIEDSGGNQPIHIFLMRTLAQSESYVNVWELPLTDLGPDDPFGPLFTSAPQLDR